MAGNRQGTYSGPVGIWRRLGAGTRVAVLVALAFVPILALHGFSIAQISDEQRAHVEHDVRDLSDAAALIAAGSANAAEQTALALSEVQPIRSRDAGAASAVLVRVVAANPAYVGLWAAGPDGSVYATALPASAGAGTSIAGEPYFVQARESRQPVVATARSLPGQPGVFAPLVAVPVLVDSTFAGTVQVAFGLSLLERIPTHPMFPGRAVVTIVDGRGTVVFRSLDPQRWAGADISGQPVYQQARSATGVFVATDLDGVTRVLGVAPVVGTDWIAIVGVSAADAFAPLNATLLREALLFALTVVLAGVFAWRGKVLADQVEEERLCLAATLSQLPEGVLVADPDGVVLQGNQALATILGRAVRPGAALREQVEGTVTWLADGRQVGWEELPFERARRGEVVRGAQVAVQRADGTRRDLLLHAMPLRGPSGAIEEVIAVLADVTALKDLDRAKDEFISIAAHELRNPLAGIKGYTGLLLRRVQEKGYDPETIRMVAAADEQADRLAGLTGRLLDVSRLQLARLELVRQPTDIVALAREVRDALQLTTEAHEIVVDAEPAEITGNWDAERLRQVFGNLVSNAIKYTPGGRITILLRQEPGQADALVSDQGPGIAPEQLPYLFERFRQAGATAQERAGGLGLGLYLVKGIVEAHAGRVGVESEPGHGSTFWFTLPLRAGERSRGPAPELLSLARAARAPEPKAPARAPARGTNRRR